MALVMFSIEFIHNLFIGSLSYASWKDMEFQYLVNSVYKRESYVKSNHYLRRTLSY